MTLLQAPEELYLALLKEKELTPLNPTEEAILKELRRRQAKQLRDSGRHNKFSPRKTAHKT